VWGEKERRKQEEMHSGQPAGTGFEILTFTVSWTRNSQGRRVDSAQAQATCAYFFLNVSGNGQEHLNWEIQRLRLRSGLESSLSMNRD
jgi:hypothetical protein